jgi:cellulose 1,4-beta-cellobiosidase
MLVPAAFGATLVAGQQAGNLKAEQHPNLSYQECTKSGGCTKSTKEITIDQNWRWVHKVGKPENCYTGNAWDKTACPDPTTCAQNCAVGAASTEYTSTYGVSAADDELKLGFVTQGPYSRNVGSRNYLMDDESHYTMFKLKNKEFAFDVDVSNLPCGLNGALYFVAMEADGGLSGGNKAGAKYGTGYCDAQCPHDLKFINGEANVQNWTPHGKDTGVGHYGACCPEMDIWEANSISQAYTAHSCSVTSHTRCEGVDCGDNPDHRFDGVCDKNGCDVQPFRLGNKNFFGKGSNFDIDTNQKVTVITQFITEDGTDNGALKEIRRHYIQNGKVIQTPAATVGSGSFDSITKEFCEAEVGLFKDKTNFLQKGGLASMDKAMEHGMVLVMSLWDDHDANMLWLDSDYPTEQDPSTPGVARGTCDKSSGKPDDVENNTPHASVTYSDIRFGDIGSTHGSTPGPSPGPSPGPAPTPSGCPGGSLSACIGLCPSDAKAYKACVAECVTRCPSVVV